MLGHHSNAGSNCFLWGMDKCFLTINKNFPTIRAIQSVQNTHQSSFSGTILAQKGVNFSLFQLEIHIHIGFDRTERLVNMIHFNS